MIVSVLVGWLLATRDEALRAARSKQMHVLIRIINGTASNATRSTRLFGKFHAQQQQLKHWVRSRDQCTKQQQAVWKSVASTRPSSIGTCTHERRKITLSCLLSFVLLNPEPDTSKACALRNVTSLQSRAKPPFLRVMITTSTQRNRCWFR